MLWVYTLVFPHDDGLQALYEKLEERTNTKTPSTDLVEIAEFILKNNFFECNTKIILQIFGTAIGTKFDSPVWIVIYE